MSAMEWWGWIAWAVALVTSGAGLALGIRSARRERYLPLWVLGAEPRIVNRTGEDAAQVLIFIENDERLIGCYKVATVVPGDAVSLPDWAGKAEITAVWIRPSTGRMYVWPWSFAWRWRTRRLRRSWSAVRRRHRRRAFRRGQLWIDEPQSLD